MREKGRQRESGGWVGWGVPERVREKKKERESCSTVKVFDSALVLDAIFRK